MGSRCACGIAADAHHATREPPKMGATGGRPHAIVPAMPPARELLDRFPRAGRLEWVGIRPGRNLSMRSLDEATLIAGRGLAGDRYAEAGNSGDRQISIFQAEHLAVVTSLTGREVDPLVL